MLPGGVSTWGVGFFGEALAISGDGTVFVGLIHTDGVSGGKPFKGAFDSPESLVLLPFDMNRWQYGAATDANIDGSTIVGYVSRTGSYPDKAGMIWTGSSYTEVLCRDVENHLATTILEGVSSDGRFVVGAYDEIVGRRPGGEVELPVKALVPFLYDRYSGTCTRLCTPEDGVAFGISSDGEMVVGTADNHAFVAKVGTSIQCELLPPVQGFESYTYEAYDISNERENGTRIIVGKAYTLSEHRAVLWVWSESGETAAYDLTSLFSDILSPDSVLHSANAVSRDGLYVVGYGHNADPQKVQGYLLTPFCTPHSGDVNNDGCVDDADLFEVLLAIGCQSSCGRADVNCNGVVDDADLLVVLANYGLGC